MSTIPASSCPNYMAAPFIQLPVNKKGQIITEASAVVKISYNELQNAKSTIEAITYRVMDIFRSISLGFCCPCRHKHFKVIKEVQLDPINPGDDLMQKMKEFEKEHPLDFTYTILERNIIHSDPPKMRSDLELLAEDIQSLLIQNKLSSTPDHVKKLLLARDIALATHERNKESIVSISSKSTFFDDINLEPKIKNAAICVEEAFAQALGNAIASPKSLASVRVFPNGSSSLTIPLLDRVGGGIKILNPEIYIGPDNAIFLMRRVKLRTYSRANWADRTIANIYKVATCTHPGILIPKTLYLHPKKGLEYLVENCKKDFFFVIQPYALLDIQAINCQDPLATDIVNTPIDTQIRTHLGYMKAIVEAVQYMHGENLLHNDLKPDNILLNTNGVPVLCDFDFSCSFEEGVTMRIKGGTLGYVKPNAHYKNLSTDLFALATTFWVDNPSLAKRIPCFMNVFQALHTLAKTKSPELTVKIEKAITSLKSLCTLMKDGTPVIGGKIYPTLEMVIAGIQQIQGEFPVT